MVPMAGIPLHSGETNSRASDNGSNKLNVLALVSGVQNVIVQT